MNKTVLTILGALGLVILGAWGMWTFNKISTPAATSAVAATPASTAPVPTTKSEAPPANNMAQVVSVKPHYVEKSVAYRSCHAVAHTEVTAPPPPTGAGAIIGGLAGGVAASNIGHGDGKTAATIGGALLGAVAGNAVEGSIQQPQTQTVFAPECVTKYTKKSVHSGFEVTYTYNGQQGVTVMDKAPIVGTTIPVKLTPTLDTK